MSEHRRPELRLVRGGRGGAATGRVRVTLAPPGEAPSVDAVVFEEDTWLILAAGMEVTGPAGHPVRLLTELHDTEPLAPGTVLVREGRPLALLAVVHDFGAEPCCQTEWIEAALARILRVCRERQLRSILLPLFGVRHGKLAPEAMLSLVTRALREGAPKQLKSVAMHVPPGGEAEVRRLLAAGSWAED